MKRSNRTIHYEPLPAKAKHHKPTIEEEEEVATTTITIIEDHQKLGQNLMKIGLSLSIEVVELKI